MKQKIFLGLSLLAMAGLWTGCSNDDEMVDTSGNGQEISFRVQGGTPTLRTTATTLPYVDAFVIYGTDNLALAADPTDNIFAGVTVARKVGAGDVFDYNPKKYYSVGATSADFVAYSPASAKITSTATNFSNPVSFGYTVPIPTATGNTVQEDLLVAGANVVPSTTAVSLAFQHALSRIFVKATNALKDPVVIKGLTLKNLLPSGTITGTSVTTDAWTWAWTPSGTKTDYPYILATTGVAVPANTTTATLVTSMEQGMMVIPQKTDMKNDNPTVVPAVPTFTDFALEVTYDVGNLVDQTAYVLLTDQYEFVKGTQYAITIAFDASATKLIEVNFSITVAPFTNDATMP